MHKSLTRYKKCLQSWKRNSCKVAIAFCLFCLLPSNLAAASDTVLPQVIGRNWDGNLVSLRREFNERPMIVNFWATWCAPCKRELPELVKLEKKHPGVDFVFVHAFTDPKTKKPLSPQQLKDFLKPMGIKLQNTIITGTRNGTNAGVEAYPTTLLISASGSIDQKLLEYSVQNMEILRVWLSKLNN